MTKLEPIKSDVLNDAHLDALMNIESILNKAHPEESNSFGHRLYLHVTKVTKYLGIPAIVLAAILPIYDLLQNSRNSLSEKYLVKTFADYAVSLSESGYVDRAEKIFKMVERKGDLNPKIQYVRAKIFAEGAILKGKNIEEAEDLINILLKLNKHDSLFIEKFGEKSDFEKLIIMLSDIHTSNSEYKKYFSIQQEN